MATGAVANGRTGGRYVSDVTAVWLAATALAIVLLVTVAPMF